MPETKECPWCGGRMRLKGRQESIHVPGNPKPTVVNTVEWICTDCDYFEEAGQDET